MKIKHSEWNLKLVYKNENDPQIESDIQAIEAALTKFEKKYKGKDFTSTSKKLKQALDDYYELDKIINNHKPTWYLHLKYDTNSADKKIQALYNKATQRLTVALNKSTFFRLALGSIPQQRQDQFLKDPSLNTYTYLLKKIFQESRYDLSEGEEQLSSLLAQPAKNMWTEGQLKLLNSQTVIYKGKNIPIPQAVGIIPDLPKTQRRELYLKVNEAVRSISSFAEAEINAVYNYKKILDERRGYSKPYSATVISYENDEKTVENLLALVTKKFSISHRFYKIHAKIIGEKKITAADRGVKAGSIKRKFDFATSVQIVRKAFMKVDPKYSQIVDRYLNNGQFDVYPRKGKYGGAYCSPGGDNPTFVLLNHTDDLRSYETLAHEMGHAFHTELSKSQPIHYRDYTMATAEVASTFFEQVALEELEGILSERDYLVLLHNKIMGDITTIFAQTAFFNAELELHNRIRKEGFISKEEMAKVMAKHFRSYLGNAVDIKDEDGYFFVRLSHLRYYFYMYTYVYGQLISKALFEKWKADPSYIKKIEQFLSAGGSMSPEDIFKKIGINTSDSKFFELGLKSIEKDIVKLEKLAKKVK